MDKLYNSVRVSACHWLDDARFEEFLSVLEKSRESVQQVAFFTSYYHPPMPLELAEKHCRLLASRMDEVRRRGFSCGLNLLSTAGHHPEAMRRTLKGDWPLMTNSDGEGCAGSRCFADRRCQEEYIKPLYLLHCAARPDFIWIDDDIRSGHYPVGECCFCDGCVAAFNRFSGGEYTRQSLAAALKAPENLELRKLWLRFNSEKITDLFKFIRSVVDSVNPGITLGFMTGDRFPEGYDFAAWADALSDGGKHELMWRPGGGAYTDERFSDFIDKASSVGRQCANLPPYVKSVQSEIEAYPYQTIKKSPRSTAIEAMLYVAAGCTGAALNNLPNSGTGEPISLILPHVEAMNRMAPFMRRCSDAFGRSASLGIRSGWSRFSKAAFPDGFNPDYLRELHSFGLPEAFSFDSACCYSLTGRAPYAFERGELLKMLSKGVYLDAGAVIALSELGLGEYVGFSCDGVPLPEATEIYADHPLNEGFVGGKRVLAPVFGGGTAFALTPASGAETLCRLTDDVGSVVPGEPETDSLPIAACSMGIFRNSLGGTVCAASYCPYSHLSDSQKSVQLRRVFRLLGGGKLPACVETYARVLLHARGGGIALLNQSLDALTELSVLVAGSPKRLLLTDERLVETELLPRGRDGAMTRFVVPKLGPYEFCLITGMEK